MASGERGGGADHLVGLLPELMRLGVACTAVVSPDGPLAHRLEASGLDVQRVEMMRSRFDAGAVVRLRSVIVGLGADIVHAHGTRGAFFVAVGRAAPALVYTAHGLSYNQSLRGWRRSIFFGAEAVVCRAAAEVVSVSAADLLDLRRRGLLAKDAGVHIPNAVDTDRFGPGDREAARRRLGLPLDAFVVGTVSRLVPQKSVHDMIDATILCPEVTLVIVGDGLLRGDLETRSQVARERIHFLGARDDVPEVLPAFDVFVLSSRWEGDPIALLEALATGLPCVATATSGAREVLEEGALGVLVDIGSPQAMASTFHALRVDPIARKSFGDVGRASMRSRSWARSAEQLVDVYEAVASSAR
jgi:glycosyltransferase involved in cell wall biosynthesis